ncbi:hypothetical protein PHET_08918 [Paragonimus heterotremus]|uniref:Uncharacterized protein n=1 Tax=Paragonimus heterotremus TaxID=100268 RepID=A0A8J4SVR9_9TREM|nr:hypothetical protein PHET_08918 [Paragonimus heterotremus]
MIYMLSAEELIRAMPSARGLLVNLQHATTPFRGPHKLRALLVTYPWSSRDLNCRYYQQFPGVKMKQVAGSRLDTIYWKYTRTLLREVDLSN